MEINKVIKLQTGGYVGYQPIPMVPQEQPQQQAAPEESGKKKDDDGLDDGILKKMIGEGITTDVMQYSQSVNQAYQRYSMMDDNMKNSYLGKQLRQVMKGDLGQLNAIWRGKKMLDASIAQSQTLDGLNEGAVTQDNQVVVKQKSTGKITTLSLGQIAEEQSKKDSDYKILTNSELAQEREYNPQLVNNGTVFSVIGYAKGIDKIREEVLKVVSSIGSSSRTTASGSYGDPSGDDTEMGALQSAAASGAFKIKDGSTVTSNKPQIEKAKQTLWATLGENAKATLRLRAATVSGGDPSKIESIASTMAASLLDPHTSEISKEIHDETFKKLAGGNGGSGKMADVGANEAAFVGRYNNQAIGIKGPKGESLQMNGDLLPATLTVGKDGTRTTLRQAAALQGISTGVDKAFTVNGDKVKPDQTVITGNTYIAKVPVRTNDKGGMMVDEEGVKKMAQVEKAFSALPANERTDANKSQLMRKFGASSLNLQDMIIGEAVSYSDHIGWFDNRDPNYYDAVDEQTEKLVGEIVDPKEKGIRSGKDPAIHKHLVFIPAGSQAQFREADGNHAVWNQSAFDLHQYNTGPGGASIHGSVYNGPSATTPPANATKDYWKQ